MRGGRQRLSLRGGLDNFVIDELDPLKHVTTLAQAEEAIKHVKLFEDQVDGDLLAGDMFRMNHGWKVGMDEYEQLQENFADTSVQFHLTQQFLILQNERIKSLLPGGSNCTYADSWMTGQLWDRADDEFRWTRSAWTQAKRARTWEEMPAVWKKIMTQQWVEFQEFLAMLALPDAGVGSERYKEHVKAWEMMQTGYMSNLEKTMAEYHDGGKIRDEVERDGEEAKKLYDFRSSEPRVNTLWEWATNKLQHIARMNAGKETEEDKLSHHIPIDVHFMGVTLFNTKDPVSERLWSFGQSQGEALVSYPLKCLAWVAKKAERLGTLGYPVPAPTVSDVHVLLNSTRYQKEYESGTVDRQRFNALEHMHAYVNEKLGMGYNTTQWNRVREELEAMLSAEIQRLVLGPGEEEAQAGRAQDDAGDELIEKLSPVDVSAPRKDINTVFRKGGGGELRLVAKALNLSIPGSQREWLDDPMADEGVMRELLIHPRIQKVLHGDDEIEPLSFVPIN